MPSTRIGRFLRSPTCIRVLLIGRGRVEAALASMDRAPQAQAHRLVRARRQPRIRVGRYYELDTTQSVYVSDNEREAAPVAVENEAIELLQLVE